jgi:hypothetical protein
VLGRAEDTSLDFAIETRRLFLSAWRLAAELGSRAVRAEHLIVALINSGQLVDETGQNQRLYRSEGMALLTGAVIRITHYRGGGEATQSNIEKLKPVDLAAAWIEEAVRRASSRTHTVSLSDILGVYLTTDLNSEVHGNLVDRARELRTIGYAPSEVELTRQRTETTHDAVKEYKAETRAAFAALTNSLTTLASGSAQLATEVSGRVQRDVTPLLRAAGDETIKLVGSHAANFNAKPRQTTDQLTDLDRKVTDI